MDPVPNQDQGYFQKFTESLLTKPNFWGFFSLSFMLNHDEQFRNQEIFYYVTLLIFLYSYVTHFIILDSNFTSLIFLNSYVTILIFLDSNVTPLISLDLTLLF